MRTLLWLLTLAASAVLPFSVGLSLGTVLLAFGLCVVLGVIAGIVPASSAASRQ